MGSSANVGPCAHDRVGGIPYDAAARRPLLAASGEASRGSKLKLHQNFILTYANPRQSFRSNECEETQYKARSAACKKNNGRWEQQLCNETGRRGSTGIQKASFCTIEIGIRKHPHVSIQSRGVCSKFFVPDMRRGTPLHEIFVCLARARVS